MVDILTRKDFASDKDWEDYLETVKEIEMETETYDYDPDYGPSAKKKSKKKDTRVASLRSSKDKKFQGHTTYKT
jgi:hypothetical protein|tara:strand:+ start:108 stop:329 length:222 start_codon:yes stop_codon:yes gene_type:complete